jgi:hypothetical protein
VDTERTLHILRHALGLDRSKLPYRNQFIAGPADVADCRELVQRGLMSEAADQGCVDPCFCVTEAGERFVTERLPRAK